MQGSRKNSGGGILILGGRTISAGKTEGEVLKLEEAFSFLGGVNGSTGELKTGGNVSGKIFVFPAGKGSTVGSYVMYDLALHKKAPAAVINETAETIVATGAVISSIPMVDRIDVSLLRTGDRVRVDADKGEIEILNVKTIETVSSAVVCDGKVLMLRRPDDARSFPSVWSLVAGKMEKGEKPEEAARREIMEETQISVSEPVFRCDFILVREGEIIWKVYPFMYRVGKVEPKLNKENKEFRWVDPEEIRTLPTVDMTYEVVAEMIGKS